jgi:hypothetical protein
VYPASIFVPVASCRKTLLDTSSSITPVACSRREPRFSGLCPSCPGIRHTMCLLTGTIVLVGIAAPGCVAGSRVGRTGAKAGRSISQTIVRHSAGIAVAVRSHWLHRNGCRGIRCSIAIISTATCSKHGRHCCYHHYLFHNSSFCLNNHLPLRVKQILCHLIGKRRIEQIAEQGAKRKRIKEQHEVQYPPSPSCPEGCTRGLWLIGQR